MSSYNVLPMSSYNVLPMSDYTGTPRVGRAALPRWGEPSSASRMVGAAFHRRPPPAARRDASPHPCMGGPRSVAAVVRWFQRLVKLFTIHCHLFVEIEGRIAREPLPNRAPPLLVKRRFFAICNFSRGGFSSSNSVQTPVFIGRKKYLTFF